MQGRLGCPYVRYRLPLEERGGRDSGRSVATSTTPTTTLHLPVSACRDRSLAQDACLGDAHSMNENSAEQVRLYTPVHLGRGSRTVASEPGVLVPDASARATGRSEVWSADIGRARRARPCDRSSSHEPSGLTPSGRHQRGPSAVFPCAWLVGGGEEFGRRRVVAAPCHPRNIGRPYAAGD